jgi:hypothetical protein
MCDDNWSTKVSTFFCYGCNKIAAHNYYKYGINFISFICLTCHHQHMEKYTQQNGGASNSDNKISFIIKNDYIE